MQRIIAALSRSGGLLVFVLLEGICLFLIVTYNEGQRDIFRHSRSLIADTTYDMRNGVSQYYKLSSTNDSLSGVIAELREQLDNAKFENSVWREKDSTEVRERNFIQQYEYTEAKVVYSSTSASKNFLTLNRGTEHGIDSKMGVFDDAGIVGIVIASNSKYSRVMSILHQNMMISAEIKRNKVFGSLVWENTLNHREMSLKYISKVYPLEIGDVVQTTGFSSNFPQGLPIGTVLEIDKGDPGSDYQNVTVKLNNDLNQVRYVYIVNNIFKKEQLKVEEEGKNE